MPLPILASGVASGLALLDQLTRIFTPLNQLIDDIHTSDDERAAARAELTALQNEAMATALALERETLHAKAAMIAAEASGESWLQRNWRPITMLSFLALIVADAFGLLVFRLAEEAWLLLQIGLGGYVVGRSVEKISPQLPPFGNGAHHPTPPNRPSASHASRTRHRAGEGGDD